MLEAFIIEKLRQRERQRDMERPQLEIPRDDDLPPRRRKEDEPLDKPSPGAVIEIDL